MNDKTSSVPVWFQLVAILVFCSFAVYYFSNSEGNQKALKPIHLNSQEFHPGWMVMTSENLERTFDGDLPAPWSLEIARTILSRWLYREQSPQLWEKLMDDYESGLWISPEREKIAGIVGDSVGQWEVRRSRAGKIKPQLFPEPQTAAGVITYRFNPPVDPACLGSELLFEIDSSLLSSSGDSPSLYWNVNGLGKKAEFRRLGIVDVLPENRVRVTFDMATQPMWISPGALIHSLEFVTNDPEATSPFLSSSDSPLLPIAE